MLGVVGTAVIGVNPAGAVAFGVSGFGISPSPAPTIFTGTNGQAASNVTFSVADWASADTITFSVSPNGTTINNCTSGNSVVFAALPTVTATPISGNTTPTFNVALAANSGDTGSCTNDQVVITFTNGASSGTAFALTMSNISYNVGTDATFSIGPVALSAVWSGNTTPAPDPNATVLFKGATNVTANNPAVQIMEGTGGSPSNIVVTETSAGAVTDSICIAMASGSVPFTFTSAGTASANGSGVIGSPPSSTSSTLLAPITTSSTSPTTYTFSGFGVTAGTTTGAGVVTVSSGGADCSHETTSLSLGVTIFGSSPTLNPAIAGADTDGTAISELEAAYPPTGSCTGGKVILATDQNFPDALAASYLAGNLHTGILLTPTGGLSAETQQALQTEGISNVYVVGGPLAISQNVINQIEALPAYTCGGGSKTGSNVTVTGPIFGQTQYDTAQQIATYVTSPAQNIGTANLSGAYVAGQYNDTTGMESSSPSATGALRTAIVTSGLNFPDATAGSIISYRNNFPVVLTDPSALSSQASTTLTALGIKQALVLGGPLAVSDADVAAIQALGISVIRIAGQDQTDTAQEMANFELNQSGNDTGLGWGATSGGNWGRTILLARGDFYADALAGSVLGAIGGNPILLTENPSSVGQYLTTFLNAGGSPAGIDNLNAVGGYSGNIQTIQPLGGPLALQFTTLSAATAAVAAG